MNRMSSNKMHSSFYLNAAINQGHSIGVERFK